MDRCLACQQELWGDESSCPECGAPIRPLAARVDTSVRDRFVAGAIASATPDADFEYAFGGKRSVLRATAAPKAKPKERAGRFGRRASRVVPTEMADEGKSGAATTVTDLLRTVRDTWGVAEAVAQPVETVVNDVQPAPAVVAVETGIVETIADPEPAESDGVAASEPPTAGRPRRFGFLRRSRVAVPVADDEAPAERVAAQQPDDAPAIVEVSVVEPVPAEETTLVEAALVAEAPQGESIGKVSRKREPRLVSAIALIVVAAAVTTGVVLRSDQEPSPVSAAQVVTSATDDISFVLPGGWRLESQDKGVMELTDPRSDSHVYASVIKRKSLKDGLTLRQRAKQVRTQLLRSLDAAQMSEPVSTKVGRYEAIRTEISAEAVGRSVSYIHTVVKTPREFVNILAWAPAEQMGAEERVLLEIVESFRATD